MPLITDPCPECGQQLDFDEVDIGVGTQKGNFGCWNCYWTPGAIKVTCECGCGKMSYSKDIEFNHPKDYQNEERG